MGDAKLLEPGFPNTERDIDCFDPMPTTYHFVAYACGGPVGTVRLLTPNREIAKANQMLHGLPIEAKVDLTELSMPGMSLGEVSRFSILPEWRRTRVFRGLCSKMAEKSGPLGLTHWVGAATTTTDCPRDANLLHKRMVELGHVSPVLRVRPRKHAAPTGAPRAPLYSEEERRRYERGDTSVLKLPSVLQAYLKVGAVFTGEPVFDPYFNIYFLPLIAPLDAVRAYLRGSEADTSRECPIPREA
jgi:hypothetical protein